MKSITTKDIISRVRIKLDEIGLNESDMVGDTDNSDIDTVIKSCIGEAHRLCVLNADASLLEGEASYPSLSIGSDMVGRVSLPPNFLRLVSVRLSSWQSAASEVIEEGSPEYRMQSDPYCCGTWYSPVAALVYNGSTRQIELYKAKTTTDTLRSFVTISQYDGGDTVSVPDQLEGALIYYVAMLTATTFREDVAADFQRIAKSMLGIE